MIQELKPTEIRVSESVLEIDHFFTTDRSTVLHFLEVPEAGRVDEMERALRIGATCLDKAQAGIDLDSVQMRVDKMLFDFQNAMQSLPEALTAKLSTDEGAALFPVAKLMEDVQKGVSGSLEGVRSTIHQSLDPHNPASLAKALELLGNLLNPQRTDSVQHKLVSEIEKVAGKDGALAKSVGEVVTDAVSQAVRPLKDRIAEMEKQILDEKRMVDIAQQHTAKGYIFEDELLVKLEQLADKMGACLERVGGDNKPGDFLLTFRRDGLAGIDLAIVIEAKDEVARKGKVQVQNAIAPAMSQRRAQIGIFVVKRPEALAEEVSNFHEGNCNEGTFFACSADNLRFVLNLAVLVARLRAQREDESIDHVLVQSQIDSIRTSLQKIRAMKAKATNIDNLTTDIRAQLGCLQAEIEDAACRIEGSLKAS